MTLEEQWLEGYCPNQWEPNAETPQSYYEFFVKSQQELLEETVRPLSEEYAVVRGVGPASRGEYTALSTEGYYILQDAGLYDLTEVKIAFHYCKNDWPQSTPPPLNITIGDLPPAGASGDSIPAPRQKRNQICVDTRTGREESC